MSDSKKILELNFSKKPLKLFIIRISKPFYKLWYDETESGYRYYELFSFRFVKANFCEGLQLIIWGLNIIFAWEINIMEGGFVVVKDILMTDENGNDFVAKEEDVIEIDDGEVYWINGHDKKILTNMRVDHMKYLYLTGKMVKQGIPFADLF